MKTRTIQSHIVMSHKAYPPWVGGVERHVGDVSEALVQRGWQVTVLTCNHGNYETREWQNGVRVIRVPRWGTFLSQPLVTRYFKRLRELEVDLFHVHVPFPLGWFAANAMYDRAPIVCTWHSDIIRQRFLKPFYAPWEQLFLSRCNCILTTSEPLQHSSRALRRHQDRCQPLPLALPPKTDSVIPQETVRRRYAIQHPMVLFVGRLVKYKGLPYLLHAMKEVPAHLYLAGEGPERHSLHRLVKENQLENKIHFLGYVSEEEKQALYCLANVFVLPSINRNEAFGYVLLEAMEAGCPVISTQLPTGVSFVNVHEETGFVVPPHSEEALRNAILRIISDETLRSYFSQQAQQRIKCQFHFEKNIDQLEEVYDSVLTLPSSR